MLRNGFVTFGVFNRTEKISDSTLGVWSEILRQIPNSRIVVKNGSLDDALLRDTLLGRFAAHGIAVERVTCFGSSPQAEHLARFADIDMSLDPFPQNGGVSTWESLLGRSSRDLHAWRQRLFARRRRDREGGQFFDEWVAEDDNGYVAIAVKFANRPDEMRQLRAELPAKAAGSDAANNEFYTRRVEDGYRQFWRRYCAAQG